MRTTKKRLADLERKVQSLQEQYDGIVSRLDSGFDFARCMAKEQAAVRGCEGEQVGLGYGSRANGGSLNRASSQGDALLFQRLSYELILSYLVEYLEGDEGKRGEQRSTIDPFGIFVSLPDDRCVCRTKKRRNGSEA